jgi:Flp pilus assembly protein TadB
VPDFASVYWLSILECFLCCIVFLCFATQDEDQKNTKTQWNTETIQEWTTQRHWQSQAQKTQDEDQKNTKTQYNTENIQEWTTKRHWQNQAHKTQDEDQQNTKTQYNTENNVVLCFCVLLVFVLCLVCLILPVSLGCPFLNVFCDVLCF